MCSIFGILLLAFPSLLQGPPGNPGYQGQAGSPVSVIINSAQAIFSVLLLHLSLQSSITASQCKPFCFCRALKETQDQQALLVPKEMR